jgi:protein SCO1/2
MKMSFLKNCVSKTIFVLFTSIALIAVFFVIQPFLGKKKIDPNNFHGTLLDKPREVKPFELIGIDSRPFTNESLKGQWTLLFFGFTNCGYICPTTMTELTKMYQILEKNRVHPLPKVVLISVDPERDNQEKLWTYINAFHPSFYGARGEDAVIQALTKEMGIAYTKIRIAGKPDGESYDVEHSGSLILFNPKGELSAFFTMPHRADSLAKDYQRLAS